MAHPEMEAVEVTDVNSAADAIAQMDGIFDNDEIERTDEEIEQAALDEAAELEEERENTPEEASEDADEEENTEVEELEEVIQAPVSWSKEQKDIFAKLPPEAQEVIHLRESQRDKAFQEKSTEIAEQRKAYEANLQRIEQERQEYTQTLNSLMEQSLPPKPSIDLLNPNSDQYNPEHYHLLKAQHEQGLEYVEALKAEKKRVAEQQQTEQAERFKEYVAQQDAILKDRLPEWNNPGIKQELAKYATDEGYSADQLKMASAKDIITLHKAMQYDALMAKKPNVQDKIKVVPKVTRPGTPSSQTGKFEAKQAKFNRLRQTGSVEDGAKVLLDLI